MVENLQRLHRVQNPSGFDRLIVQIQATLSSKIGWLDHIFGLAEKLAKEKDKKRVVYPAVRIRKDEYQSVLPSEKLGSFCFFTLKDPINVDFNKNRYNILKARYKLIFWVKPDKTPAEDLQNEQQKILDQVLRVFTGEMNLNYGSLDVDKIELSPEEIFKGFTIDPTNKSFMHPYMGISFEGTLVLNEAIS